MSLDQATKELQAALAKLKAGHALITQQISTLESFLSSVGGPAPKRRGRPPKAAAAPAAAAKKAPAKPGQIITTKSGVKRRKANWSPAAREAARKRMQEYWAQRRRKG